MTLSTCSSVSFRGAPGRGSSSSPSTPARRNRERHLPTVGNEQRIACATSVLLLPLAQASTMWARKARACADLRRRVQLDSVCRCCSDRTSGAIGRPRFIVLIQLRRWSGYLVNELTTQYTSCFFLHFLYFSKSIAKCTA